MKRILLFVFFILCLSELQAQTSYTVSGIIKDTSGKAIISATVQLAADKDTFHTVSSSNGKFRFTNIPSPVFMLRVSSLGYTTWHHQFSYTETGVQIDLPPIILNIQNNTLKEVVIKGKHIPAVMKGDTIEYQVSQYKLRENAVVEDLLKRLPGMQIDAEGHITVLGKRITKVWLNGQEYLVDDIKSLTRLLPADMIDKIQLINDYGDMAGITGRKMGVPERVINLQTKANSKDVYQAQGMAGAGNDGRYTAALMANYLGKQQQLSFIGNTNNTSALEGNTTTTTGNINYRGKFKKGISASAGLTSGRTVTRLQSYSTVQTVTSDGTLYNINNSNANNQTDNYNFTSRLDHKGTSGNFFRSFMNLGLSQTNSHTAISSIQSGFQRKDQITINDVTDRIPTLATGFTGAHRFTELGRIFTMSLLINYAGNNNKQDGIDTLRYYKSNNAIAKDSLLHRQLLKPNNTIETNADLSYIEPLDSLSSLALRYSLKKTDNNTKLQTFWINADGKSDLIDSLSNHYKFNLWQHQVEFNYRRNKGRVDYTLGVRMEPSILQVKALPGGQSTTIRSSPIVPVCQLQYKLPKTAIFTIAYVGSMTFPTYEQLLPVTDLSNVQFPVVGNPNLRPAYTHAIAFDYWKTDVNSLLLNFAFSTTNNKIVTNVVLIADSFNTVKQETHFLNSNGDYNITLTNSWSQQFSNGKYNLSLDGKSTYNNTILYMDNARKNTQNMVLTQTAKANITNEREELTGGIGYTYSRNAYILLENSITNISSWNFNINGKIYFLKTFSINVDCNKQINSGYNAGVTANPLLLNAALEKTFFKHRMTCRIQGTNLLDETSNLSQSVSGNAVTQNRNTLLGRYFILSFRYDLRILKKK